MLNTNSEPEGFGDSVRYVPDENAGLIDEIYEDQKITVNDVAVSGDISLI